MIAIKKLVSKWVKTVANLFKRAVRNRSHAKRRKTLTVKNGSDQPNIVKKVVNFFAPEAKKSDKNRFERRRQAKKDRTTWQLVGEARRTENRRLALAERKKKRCRKIADESRRINRLWAKT